MFETKNVDKGISTTRAGIKDRFHLFAKASIVTDDVAPGNYECNFDLNYQ